MPLALSPTTAFDIAGLAFAVAVIVEVTKFLFGYFLEPADPNQNNVIRLYVFAVALAVVAGSDFLTYHLGNRADVLSAISSAFSVGATAIALYHVLTSDQIPGVATVVGLTPRSPGPTGIPLSTETPPPA